MYSKKQSIRKSESKKDIIKGVSIKEEYTDTELIEKILKHNHALSRRKLSEILKYNVLTVQQLSSITCKSVDAISMKIKLGKLSVCYPYPNYTDTRDIMFVFRNEKLAIYVAECLSIG